MYFLLTQAHVCFNWFSGTDKDYKWTKISFKISIIQAINPSLDELLNPDSHETQFKCSLELGSLSQILYIDLIWKVFECFCVHGLNIFFYKAFRNSLLLNTVHITGKLCHRAMWDTMDYFSIIVFPFIDHRQLPC